MSFLLITDMLVDSSGASSPFLRYILAGALQRDTLITPQGKMLVDTPGGSLLYAAGGIGIWDKAVGLIGCVGEDYPQEWLRQLEAYGFDTRGIKILPRNLDLRNFIVYENFERLENENPIPHYARLGLPLPKFLLGYHPPSTRVSRYSESMESMLRLQDIPQDYTDASAVHICPLYFQTQSLLCSVFRQKHVTTLTLDPSGADMEPGNWEKMKSLFKEITALLVSEEKLSRLFINRSNEVWEMMEAVAAEGSEFIVVKRGKDGQYLYEKATKRKWMIPAYSSRLVDPTGCGDAFCGGFLAGYRNTYDPLEAVLYGNISSSLNIEGSGPFYGLKALPELAEARRYKLRELVRKI